MQASGDQLQRSENFQDLINNYLTATQALLDQRQQLIERQRHIIEQKSIENKQLHVPFPSHIMQEAQAGGRHYAAIGRKQPSADRAARPQQLSQTSNTLKSRT